MLIIKPNLSKTHSNVILLLSESGVASSDSKQLIENTHIFAEILFLGQYMVIYR